MFWAAHGLHWRLQRAIFSWPERVLANLLNRRRAWDWPLQLLVMQRGMPCKRESSTRIEYVPALCTHRPSLLPIEWFRWSFSESACEPGPAWRDGKLTKSLKSESFRGRRSRNKVSVGEPAEGSITLHTIRDVNFTRGQIRHPRKETGVREQGFCSALLFKSLDSNLSRTRMDSP